MIEAADYVIVGGGTAGAILATRLSEDPSVRVLLLEAGPDARGWRYRIPALTIKLIGDAETDWRYPAEPDPSLNGRRPLCPAGRMLGGSSAMNGMVYIRGVREDYDGWAEDAPGWSFDEVLPYFIRSETFDGASPAHGATGPLPVSRGRARHPLAGAFIDACAELGMPRLEDYCGGDQSGAFYVHGAIGTNGFRASTADAFLRPVMRRPNLEVLTGWTAESLLLEGRRAVGVRARNGGEARDFRAAAEVVVSCGAYGSPALLLRSGIGPGVDLAALGILVAADLPGVGGNLQEHVGAGVSKLVDQQTYNAPHGLWQYLTYGAAFALARRGPIATSVVQAMAFGRRDGGPGPPEFMLSFLPLCIDYRQSPPALHSKPGVHIGANICRPRGRGRVSLASPESGAAPLIRHALLADDDDLSVVIAAARTAEAVFRAGPLARHVVGTNLPSIVPTDDREWEQHVRGVGGPSYHPAGTCRMGQGASAVVGPDLRVHGIQGLRVADASIMPTVTSGNTVAPVMMIAERAADLIRVRS